MVLNGKKNISEFDEEFINNYDEDIDKGYIIEEDINYRKNVHDLNSDLPFLQERMEINKCNKLYAICMINKLCCSHETFKIGTRS